MKIAVIGLGLIGGSLAKTIRLHTPHAIYAADLNQEVLRAAVDSGAVDAPLTPALLRGCDVVAAALYPQATVAWLHSHAAEISPQAVVFDCGGVKAPVCSAGFALAQQYGFAFFGGHPMAGTERSGWQAARAGLFDGASMLLVPPEKPTGKTATAQAFLEELFLTLGFGRVVLTTATEHDRTIAYTSQLAHVASSAYIKSPTAQNYAGFSAGSFKDMTRVAFLNETMWTELFLENAGPLAEEIDLLIAHLDDYRQVIRAGDADGLKKLLAEGRELKIRSEQAAGRLAPALETGKHGGCRPLLKKGAK